MKIKNYILVFVIFSSFIKANAQNKNIDVLHYSFTVSLSDKDNIINSQAVITIQAVKTVNDVKLDLVKKRADGKGMTVTSVEENNKPLEFSQDSQHLVINEPVIAAKLYSYKITYSGQPADGLIISVNKFGERTFFADNWPNRAHNWIPCNDHPSDKATVEFYVTAPDHYQIISNGLQAEETNLPEQLKLTHWKEDVPISTKLMVIGAADFAVNYTGNVDCIPVYSWVYPENKDSGFSKYALAKKILPFYIQKVGPYAFEKLANVQSTTIYGGMENASAIFYFENSVQNRGIEALLAHEIAHQWFGDAATEEDWPHIWLSEGFATYMTNVYHENVYGIDSFNKRMEHDREKVIAFSKQKFTPVVDTTESNNLVKLLNANSYEKGGWVLHMLRRKLGDSLFWKGIRNYYKIYDGKNASTDDFKNAMEQAVRIQLDTFFQQWLYTAGQPELRIKWKWNEEKKSLSLKVDQEQEHLFDFPLELLFKNGNNKEQKKFQIYMKSTTLEVPVSFNVAEVITDPYVNLLFESKTEKIN